MKIKILYILFLLLPVADLWSTVNRNIVYNEDYDYYAVDIEISNASNLLFMHYEDVFPEGWYIEENFTNFSGLSNYLIQGNVLTWEIENGIEFPLILSYAIKSPAESSNSSVVFTGKLAGWDQYTFAKEENLTQGDNELFKLDISTDGPGNILSSSQARWFLQNTQVDISAIPFSNNSVFRKWTYESGFDIVDIFTKDISLNIDGPIDLIAYFDKQWTLNSQGSQISPSKDYYSDGEIVEVIADVPYGFEFDYWSGNQVFQNNNPLYITVLDNINIEPVLKAKEWPAFTSRKIEHLENNLYKVSFDIFPNNNSSIFAFEELIPDGWKVTLVNQSGIFDERNSKVKWGVFYGSEKQTLSYHIMYDEKMNFGSSLYGDLSIDGFKQKVDGDDSLVLIAGTDNTAVNIQEDITYDHKNGIIMQRVISPKDSISVYAYEEYIRDGWEVEDISHYGLFDERNSKIKWGLFFGDEPVTIQYKLIPSINDYIEIELSGTASFDGIGNHLINQDIVQPAKSSPETAWVEMRNEFVHTESTPVSIYLYPENSTSVYALEKFIPDGWGVQDISHDGVFDEENKKIKWGLFTSSQPLMLSYKLVPDFSVQGANNFEGFVSFDGISKNLYGNLNLNFGNFAYWLLEHFMSHPYLALPYLDVDGDGLENILEYGIGTDPFINSSLYPFYDVYVENGFFVYELFIQKDDLDLNPLIKYSLSELDYFSSETVQIDERSTSIRFEVPLSNHTNNLFMKAQITYDPQ